ncbi:hypothetical protein [Glutamicibacter ardleyensis]|uniref:hypothetical protein n=1 Tax=Glutamicibacter ardleyensis TaxID=225894 RepID=UPI003FD5B579
MAHVATENVTPMNSFKMPNLGALDLQQMVDEPLLPELEPYLRHDSALGKGLHHPLVVEPIGVVNGLANRIYTSKTIALQQAIATQDWETATFIHERPYRVEAFVKYALRGECIALADLSPELRLLVTRIWSDSENHHEMRLYWERFFAKQDGKLLLADERGRELYETLPEVLTVYRGDHLDSLRISWSLDKATGEFFAKRYNERDRTLLTGTVKKEHIYGVLVERHESEVLVDMRHVNITDRRSAS